MGKCLFMRKGETHTAPEKKLYAKDISVGSTVYCNVDGVRTEFIIVNQGIPSNSSLYDSSCNGTWLLMKDIYNLQKCTESVNTYGNSAINTWLNDTFLNMLDIKSSIITCKIPYTIGNGTDYTSALSCKVFLLSACEIGNYNQYLTVKDSGKLDYFLEGYDSQPAAKRIAYYQGIASSWWTRTPLISNTSNQMLLVTESGYVQNGGAYTRGIRPAFIIPFETLFDEKTMEIKGAA